MHQQNALGFGPFLDTCLVAFNGVRSLALDRVAIRKGDGGREHVFQAQRPELREHRHDSARRARGYRRKRPVFGRILHSLRAKEFRRRTGRRNAECIDADDFAGVGVVDECLCLATPAQYVPHRCGCRDHGAGRIDSVAALLERDGAGGRRQRLAGNRDPVLAVQRRLLCLGVTQSAASGTPRRAPGTSNTTLRNAIASFSPVIDGAGANYAASSNSFTSLYSA